MDASRVLEGQLWRECGRRTGHSYTTVSTGYDGVAGKLCTICNRSSGHKASERMEHGLREVAAKLRGADQKAGIEWVP